MSFESASRRKRNSTTNNASEGDHRKRRRNRTTQSCLNCHTSKRMCDRKRPACARCTQLGLTGLCVYEVDDPSQRSDSQEESTRLLKRVAELEGVIRELKNKPHPRWSHPPGKDMDKWYSRSQIIPEVDGDQCASDASSPPSDSASSDFSSDRSSVHSSANTKPSNVYPAAIPPGDRRPSSSHSYYASSPQSTPSPPIMTPTLEYSQPHVVIANQSEVPQEYDLTSMFFPYPSLPGYEDNYGLLKVNQADESCFIKQHGGHCGCLHESASYNVVLELSIRLRKAADILAHSASHHMGSNCPLNQRISDLDTFATNALGNITAPPEDAPGRVIPQDRMRSNQTGVNVLQSDHIYGSNPCRTSPKTSSTSHTLRSWDVMPMVSNSPLPCDDGFMSWEPRQM